MDFETALGRARALLLQHGRLGNGELLAAAGDDLDVAAQVRSALTAEEGVTADEAGLTATSATVATPLPAVPEGAWIFVSHSHRDLEEVRRVRNALEAKGHNPLLFFLRCLDDNDELDDLIKREIESRTWFLLCDSPNARASKWVQMELDYIRALPDKYTTSLDLTHDWVTQLEAIADLSRRVTIYMSYASADVELVRPIAEALEKHEYRVYFETEFAPGADFAESLTEKIDLAAAEGFILVFLSPNSLQSTFVRQEIFYAFESGGMVVAAIIAPFEKGTMPPAIELVLSRYHHLDFTQRTFEENVQTLLDMLRRWEER